jgi:hypothetical protein
VKFNPGVTLGSAVSVFSEICLIMKWFDSKRREPSRFIYWLFGELGRTISIIKLSISMSLMMQPIQLPFRSWLMIILLSWVPKSYSLTLNESKSVS